MSQAIDRGTERQRRRAVIAATVGTVVEWFDFLVYGIVGPLVFARLFFPTRDPLSGVVTVFAIQFVGFVARPLGAVIFGPLGDRAGRRASMIATLMVMAISTTLIGLLPTYSSWGIFAGIALALLRVVQGIGVGGEWAGAVLLATEWASDRRRGLAGSWPQIGGAVGLVMATLMVLLLTRFLTPGAEFAAWGWRIPFLFSSVLLVVGLYIRLGVLETPVFSRLLEERRTARHPMWAALTQHPRAVLACALMRVGQQTAFYLFVSFSLVYGTTVLRVGSSLMLTAVLLAELGGLVTVPVAGWLGDVAGRRNVYRWGLAALAIYGFVYFWALDSRTAVVLVAAVVLSEVPDLLLYAQQGAMFSEAFPSAVRYSGASLGFQLASIAGGAAPLIASALLARYHSGYAIAVYLAATVMVSFVGLLLLPLRDHVGRESVQVALARP